MHKLLVAVVVLAACGDDPMQKPDAAIQQQMDAPNPPPPRDAAIDSPPLPSVREGVVIIAELKGNDPDTTATASIMNGPLFGPSTAAGGCLHYSSPEEDGISAGTISVTGTAQAITI